MTIVVTISEYDGTPEEALREMTDAQSLYEGFSHVYVASTLDELPHPMQISAVREHFGDFDANTIPVKLTDESIWQLRRDMSLQAQIDMLEDVLADRGADRAIIAENQELLRQAYAKADTVGRIQQYTN